MPRCAEPEIEGTKKNNGVKASDQPMPASNTCDTTDRQFEQATVCKGQITIPKNCKEIIRPGTLENAKALLFFTENDG